MIDASQPASDKIFDTAAFEKFLHDKIKVDGRTGNLGGIVQISQDGEGKIIVVAHTVLSPVLEVSDQEVSEEDAAPRLAACCLYLQGCL